MTHTPTERVTDPERDAEELLGTAWADVFGEVAIPIDPVRIARDLGISVYTAPMDSHISGVLAKKPGRDASIYLNKADHSNRQRFTCAHELGHYVSRVNTGDLEFEFIDLRDELAGTGADSEEVYANKFAAALLMPAEMVRQQNESSTASQLAYRFKVSEEAMRFRLTNLGLR